MSNEDGSFNSPVSPEGSTRSSVMVTNETTHTTDDHDTAALIVRDEDFFVPTILTNDEETSVEMGLSRPSEGDNNPGFGANALILDDQPTELDQYHGQSPDEIHYILSPTNMLIRDDYQVPLSPNVQNVIDHMNMPYNGILFHGQETLAEPVQNDDDDIHVIFTETTATETVESPAQHEFINNEIHYVLIPPIIDLTQDDNDNEEEHEVQSNGVTSPVAVHLTEDEEMHEMIDLTQDNDEQEEENPVQLTPDTKHSNDNEPINQLPNDPPAITELVPPVAARSSQAADQTSVIATDVDNLQQTIESSVQLHVAILSSKSHKRSNSSDEILHPNKQHIPRSVKRRCRSVM